MNSTSQPSSAQSTSCKPCHPQTYQPSNASSQTCAQSSGPVQSCHGFNHDTNMIILYTLFILFGLILMFDAFSYIRDRYMARKHRQQPVAGMDTIKREDRMRAFDGEDA